MNRLDVESTFRMMNRKFGDSLRSRNDLAMVNEALAKILCHNLVVLIHEIHELGVDPIFEPVESASRQSSVGSVWAWEISRL